MLRPSPPSFAWHPSCKIVGPVSAAGCALEQLRDLIAGNASFCVRAAQPSAINQQLALGHPVLHCETSGSSGQPKVICRSHQSWTGSFEVNRRLFGFTARDIFAVFGSFAHSLTLYGVLEAAHIGADICALTGIRPDRQLAALDQLKASVLYLTPTQLGLLCDHRSGHAPLTGVRQILFGGGRPAPGLLAKAASLFPNATVTQFYGASETSFMAISDGATPDGAVGRAYPGVEISIRDTGGDGIGEIWIKSPYLFDGYAQGGSHEVKWQDGFLTVGEMGRMDAQGNLFVAGRKSRMVTIADQNVFLDEIETFLASGIEARHIVVVACFDAVRGNRLAGIIDGAVGEYDSAEILRDCRQSLGPLKAPRALYFTDDMPMLAAGKPDLVAIGRWLEEQV